MTQAPLHAKVAAFGLNHGDDGLSDLEHPVVTVAHARGLRWWEFIQLVPCAFSGGVPESPAAFGMPGFLAHKNLLTIYTCGYSSIYQLA